ncbi:DsbC family protein [Inhella gelatinilytica]|uniref:Thiol:disulfide interchange protein n=1 Tax=Inhella gelatinilytica TaxID=2795030 RepID=A0A931IRB2_9BURK|nr:DsbC family protein [Inhella gelatinilytica]MBH9551230.1 DsbC family protein [Inhella gelatinilytica]
MKWWFKALMGVMVAVSGAAQANEAVIRKALAERLPSHFPAIDEVRPSVIPGLFEVRFGNEIRYTDAKGEYLFEGDLIDLKTRKSLTQERVEKLTAVAFDSLPFKDALVWKRGNGKQRIAVFADPNCGYCKRFERTLQDLKDVTVYTFLIPILGADSRDKSRNIWCAKNNVDSWLGWMLNNKNPERVMASCDEGAIERNLAFARRHAIHGTPAVIFEDGTRTPGALPLEALVERITKAEKRS